MKRLRIYILCCCLCAFLLLRAENVEHEHILYAHYGGEWLQDQYLSPLRYSGMKVGIGGEWWQGFKLDSRLGRKGALDGWAHVGKVDAQFGWMYSSGNHNVIYSPGVSAGWGAYYDWNFSKAKVDILLGPYLELDYLARLQGRNVNKPYSMDACIDVKAMSGVRWCFAGKKSSYRLQYLLVFNLIGVDFMPDYWQSYYELSEGVVGKVRCAGMWNHRLVRQELSLDMQFKHSTWRLGIRHEYLEYGEKNMMFSRETVEAVVGTSFRYKINPSKKLVDL